MFNDRIARIISAGANDRKVLAYGIRKLCILGKNVIEPGVLGNIEHRTRLQLDGLYDCLLVKFFRVYDDNATQRHLSQRRSTSALSRRRTACASPAGTS